MRYLVASPWAGIGDRLSLLRAAFDQSQRQVAGEIGIVHATISRFEREESTVDLTQFLALAQHFHVELSWLATGKGSIFQKEHDRIIYLGSEGASQPCRAAVELVLSTPPGICVLLEEYEPETQRYGWALETNNNPIIILPGEMKPGYIARALVDFALKGWNIRGSWNIEDSLELVKHKTVPHTLFQQWLTSPPKRTDLTALWQLGTPPALAETVGPISSD